ncbi:MAG: sel1 repeat family protein [Pseudomonas sp.]|nr:sel1 repeat family protein [Pseudomonas sp.]
MSRLFFALTLGLCLTQSAYADDLEALFNEQRYGEFLPKAESAAATGDAQALFLLGKAYHLGQGVEEDDSRARSYYEKARAAGSARASHNLGSILMSEERPRDAIPLFEEALQRGLQMPTLINLGRAYSPSDLDYQIQGYGAIKTAEQAGDYFAQAYEQDSHIDSLKEAARNYLQAYLALRNNFLGSSTEDDSARLRAKAVQWLEKGMARDSEQAWTNYGVLLLEEQDFNGARRALQQGAQRQVAAAHYHLARMAGNGSGLPAADRKAEAYHYEQAALLGLQAANRPAMERLAELLRAETDLTVLEEGVSRLIALQGGDGSRSRSVMARLEWGRFLQKQREQARTLPDKPLYLQACGLDLNQPYGSFYNLGINTSWQLQVYRSLEEPERLAIEGVVGQDGCVTLSEPLPEVVRASLNEGAVLALAFPNFTLPLALKEADDGLRLDMQAMELPIPQ